MPLINTPLRRVVAIVPAAGSGSRMGDSLPKQYCEIYGLPIIAHTLRALAAVSRIERIAVVVAPDDCYWQGIADAYADQFGAKVVWHPVGGSTRASSVLNGVREVAADFAADDWVLVHDAARPCIRPTLIEQFLDQLVDDPIGGLLALPVADTLKRGDSSQKVVATIDRDYLWRAQTPQMFRLAVLAEALAAMPTATDEAQAMESLGHHPKLIVGDSTNLKITYETDLLLAQNYLMAHET